MSPASEGRIGDGLAAATEDGIRRAVAMIDTMKTRGEADNLIAPLRGRLARIQPVRPLNFTRLLFLPLNSVIVPLSAWQRQSAGIPRPALTPLSRSLRDDWPEMDEIDGRLSGATTADTAIAMELGAKVWAGAATRLANTTAPPGWQAPGSLRESDFTQIARAAASVLAHARDVMQLGQDFVDPAMADAAITSLCRAAIAPVPVAGTNVFKARFRREPTAARDDAADPAPLATLLAVLMQLAPRADRVLAIAETIGRGDPRIVGGAHMAMEFVLDAMRRDAAGAALPIAAATIRRSAVRLAQMEDFLQVRPGPRQRLREARLSIDAICRQRLETGLAELAETRGLLQRSQADLEATCDDLRRFAQACGSIGDAAHYERTLRQTTSWLAEAKNRELDQIDRARLIAMLARTD